MKRIGIVGLWYVGLPLAFHFAKAGYWVVGFDISTEKIQQLQAWYDSTNEVGSKLATVDIVYTTDAQLLKDVDVIIVTVPTPINKSKNPDLVPLEKASMTIGKILQPWQIIVYESTVYPWCTEEVCLPLLEEYSWLKCPEDFQIWYSPERINPGDTQHTLDKIVKVVAGIDKDTSNILRELYGSIISAGIHVAPSIKVAEASKIIENTQRDINIALMNELACLFDKIGINVRDVLEASGTKWNFLNFYPGLVGGHCIGVDPYWLAFKAVNVDYHPQLILAWRKINDAFPQYISQKLIKHLISLHKEIHTHRILVCGLTFKPNVPDFRNSKVAEVIIDLQGYWLDVLVHDPYLPKNPEREVKAFGVTDQQIVRELSVDICDVLIVWSYHKSYRNADFLNCLSSWWTLLDISWNIHFSAVDKEAYHYLTL